MFDRRRQVSGAFLGAAQQPPRAQGRANLYRGRARFTARDIYDADMASHMPGGRFRWLISTCLAATVGTVAILVVIFGSSDQRDSGGLMPSLKRMRKEANTEVAMPIRREDGLKWSVPRADKLQIATGVTSTRYIIHEMLRQRVGGREKIVAKRYGRVVARLAPVPKDYADVIPPFNPFKLYATAQPVGSGEDEGDVAATAVNKEVQIKVVELLGGILPGEDGQQLEDQEVAELVERANEAAGEPADGGGAQPADGLDKTDRKPSPGKPAAEAAPPNTTVFPKGGGESDLTDDDLEGRQVRVITAARGDTLKKLLINAGADSWQAAAMIDAGKSVFPDANLTAGQEVRITLVPSLTQQNRMEPSRFSIFSEAHDHLVTVTRNAAGEFVATGTPFDEAQLQRDAIDENDKPQASSLYASFYAANLMQNVPSDTIMQLMRVHAFETDFRRRLRAGDSVEFFFDLKDDATTDGPPGEVLSTAITAGGEVSRFYRFRTPDGIVDYYDADGNNSKKFLMRRPVRGEDVRLTSGFGVRFHPLLNERRMHTGIDWATTQGTPILAAGTGVIEEAGRKGQYGNYIRIRHANGYHTAYGHMLKFAQGVEEGAKVRQGQVIGYVGSTGLSSGPHLHYEVLVNSRYVDPLSIQVPRERKLVSRQLSDFQKERARIDDLMHRAPVMQQTK